jgi:osmoprotectant transport system permease protein
VTLVCALGFENAYALAMRASDAKARGVTRISDLAAHASDFTIGGDYELFARPEWRAIRERHGLAFSAERKAAARGTMEVISAFSTDGRIDAASPAGVAKERLR